MTLPAASRDLVRAIDNYLKTLRSMSYNTTFYGAMIKERNAWRDLVNIIENSRDIFIPGDKNNYE